MMAGDQKSIIEDEKYQIRAAINKIRQQIDSLTNTKSELTATLRILESNFAALYEQIDDDWK
jgi:prefoldin subunit 5